MRWHGIIINKQYQWMMTGTYFQWWRQKKIGSMGSSGKRLEGRPNFHVKTRYFEQKNQEIS